MLTAYDFKDILLVPNNSTSYYESRKDVTLEKVISFKNGMVWKGVPIICSNIHNIATIEMAKYLQQYKMITWLSKFIDYDILEKEIKDGNIDPNYCCITLGLSDIKNYNEIIDRFPDIPFIRLDVANGYLKKFQDFVTLVCEVYGKSKIIFAGNIIPNIDVNHNLDDPIHEQFNIIKKYSNIKNLSGIVVGIGSGSVCSTRTKTGVGLPQAFAISKSYDSRTDVGDFNLKIISDGGIRTPACVSKAFALGADFVVLGGILAGHDECLGDSIPEKQQLYGMASKDSLLNHYDNSGDNKYKTYEGITTTVQYKGSVKNTIDDIFGGLRSTITYCNAQDVHDISQTCDIINVNRTVDNF